MFIVFSRPSQPPGLGFGRSRMVAGKRETDAEWNVQYQSTRSGGEEVQPPARPLPRGFISEITRYYIDPFDSITMSSASPLPLSKAVAGLRDEQEHSRRPSPQPSHLCLPHTPVQKLQVKKLIEDAGLIPASQVDDQIEFFYEKLGIDDVYFNLEKPTAIASQITSLYAAKVAALAREDKREEIRLDMEAEDHAIYIDTSEPGKSVLNGPRYEERLESKYLDHIGRTKFRVETFRSPGALGASPASKSTLRCYFVYQCQFRQAPEDTDPMETRLELISDNGFWQKATENTKQIYQGIIDLTAARTGPVIEVFDLEEATRSGWSSPGNESGRQLSPLEDSIHQITKEISLLYCLPHNRLHSLFANGELSLQEAIYGHCVWVFVQHFLNRLGSEYVTLSQTLDLKDNAQVSILSKLKRRLRTETFSPQYILDIIKSYPGLLRALYASFASTHLGIAEEVSETNGTNGTNSGRRSPKLALDAMSDDKLKETISATVANENDEMVMTAFRVFNNSVLKTNFFTPTKVGLSFRLDPSFLPSTEYPSPLYGMFLFLCGEARGFHLRFRDIARGGIRIVKSRSKEAYAHNARNLFDENYALSSTQQRKNKDIPEGGAKGVILLEPKQQDKAREAFEKYIDSILDLLLPARTPGIKNPLVDLYGKEEILFMGPDENTAELVDWATEHARIRGAPVREYVTGIYRKLNLDPSTVRKMQTGGPDGDLGSNEILLSNEKYTSVIDGSGVLVDPNGIDQQELLRLAKNRVMINNFDVSKLSIDGYRVLCDDSNVTLPSGEVVANGTTFRNTYHLRDTGLTDCFVPCGGRPESIDVVSVNKLIKNGRSTIPYMVEGANLFITQDAKLRLEAAGCVLIKDASANKGGVTSSSMEVLASLSFDDKSFVDKMCVDAKTGEAPQFYKDYVKEVQAKIRQNANLEFEAIWSEHTRTGEPRCIISDKLSAAITQLDEELQHSELWDNTSIRRGVLANALPKLLQREIGLDQMIQRVPDAYLRAIFGSFLASRFIYQYGSSPSQFAFYDFMSKVKSMIEGQ
ncbi:unnamed protein product [Parascedosporium putredinis]|uniref:NAD-specific glutamate dehydrogenase n=1 Tax=Parascedosporium putredinis TaxID=1442378 RepID=A0A9P1HAQ0_9PEZI|nr:unnamed protein product [Parascedosporium putredinis]CAI8002931.1 unnamed protein product [Parascedosporium putredinis]